MYPLPPTKFHEKQTPKKLGVAPPCDSFLNKSRQKTSIQAAREINYANQYANQYANYILNQHILRHKSNQQENSCTPFLPPSFINIRLTELQISHPQAFLVQLRKLCKLVYLISIFCATNLITKRTHVPPSSHQVTKSRRLKNLAQLRRATAF